MRFRIQYLTELADESSVCFTLDMVAPDSHEAEEFAWQHALQAWGTYKANALQIRNMDEGGKIVSCSRMV